MPFHTGQTCTESKVYTEEQNNFEFLSKKWLDANAKVCKCGRWVQKTEGCDHMTCSKCSEEWCWRCGASYSLIRRIGNTAHCGNCPHYA